MHDEVNDKTKSGESKLTFRFILEDSLKALPYMALSAFLYLIYAAFIEGYSSMNFAYKAMELFFLLLMPVPLTILVFIATYLLIASVRFVVIYSSLPRKFFVNLLILPMIGLLMFSVLFSVSPRHNSDGAICKFLGIEIEISKWWVTLPSHEKSQR